VPSGPSRAVITSAPRAPNTRLRSSTERSGTGSASPICRGPDSARQGPRASDAQGLQKPKSFPLAFDAVHIAPAPVQSAVASQTVIPGDGQDAAHAVPVKAVHSGQVTPQCVAVVGLPVPQQMGACRGSDAVDGLLALPVERTHDRARGTLRFAGRGRSGAHGRLVAVLAGRPRDVAPAVDAAGVTAAACSA